MGKLKSINWQELAFKWVDKVVIVICAVLAGWSIWSSVSTPVYKGDPLTIAENARNAERTIENNRWPEEEADQFKLNADELPERIVFAGIREPVAPGRFEFEHPFATPLTKENEPVKEPVWLPVEDLIADANEVIIPQAASASDTEETELASALPAGDDTDPQSDIPEFLRVTRPSAAAAGYGEEYGPGDDYDPSSEYEDAYGGYGGYGGDDILTRGVEADGHQYVAVRGVFPLRKQVERIRSAINAESYFEARAALDFMELNIERREFRPGSDPEQVEWEEVDLRVAEDILVEAAGIEPDAVPGRITDPVITMPLPARIRGLYGKMATHPRIENFVLSPEEQERELAVLRAMGEEIRTKGDEEKLNAPREKGGFKSFVIGSSQLYNTYAEGFDDYSGGDEYGGGYGGGGYPGSGGYPGGGGYPGSGGGYPGGGYGAPQPGLSDKALEDILKKLDPDKRDKGLRDWIKKQSSAEEELLLFRYLDFDVQPNRSYQYRVRLELRNPNFEKSVADAGGLAHVVQGETRFTDWSSPTPISTTARTTDFYVASVTPPRGRVPLTADVSVYQWDSDLGTVVQGRLEVQPGQLIGGGVNTEVLDPATPSLEVKQYDFTSNDVLLGAFADTKIEKDFHPGIKLPFGAKGGELMLPEAIVYADDAGALFVVDEVSSDVDFKRRRAILKLERDQYQDLRKSAAPEDDLENYYGDEYGDYEAEAAGYGGGGYGGPSSGRRSSNPLSRRNRR